MPMTIDELATEALNLPPEGRAELADRLVASLDTTELTEIDKLWAVEAKRRADEMTSGKVQGIPAEEVFAEIRRNRT